MVEVFSQNRLKQLFLCSSFHVLPVCVHGFPPDMQLRLTVDHRCECVNGCLQHQGARVSKYSRKRDLNQSELHGSRPVMSSLLRDKHKKWVGFDKMHVDSGSGRMSLRRMKQNASFLIRHISSVFTEEKEKLLKKKKNHSQCPWRSFC